MLFLTSLLVGLINYAWAFFYSQSGAQHFAKVKFSALVSEMRNKLNGSVFSRNRGGAYIRNKVTPLNPQTTAQQAARALLSSLSEQFRTLSPDRITAWNQAGDNFPTVDVFGDQRIPSGQQLFVGLNTNINNAGGVTILDPPAPVGAEATGALTLAADATLNTMTLAFVNTPVPATTTLIIETTEGKSAGVSNFNSAFRVIQSEPAASASPADIHASQVAKFGDLVVGLKYGARAKYIRTDTGEVSVVEVDTAIAV